MSEAFPTHLDDLESADGDLEAVADEEDDDDGDEGDGGADRPPLLLPQARRQRPIEGRVGYCGLLFVVDTVSNPWPEVVYRESLKKPSQTL